MSRSNYRRRFKRLERILFRGAPPRPTDAAELDRLIALSELLQREEQKREEQQ
jgi:hypothetical protein